MSNEIETPQEFAKSIVNEYCEYFGLEAEDYTIDDIILHSFTVDMKAHKEFFVGQSKRMDDFIQSQRDMIQ